MTTRQQWVVVSLLLMWASFWGVSFLQAREAKAQVLEMERVEVEFYGAAVGVDKVHAQARKKIKAVFSFVVDQ